MPSAFSTGATKLRRLALPRLLLHADTPVTTGARGDAKTASGGGELGLGVTTTTTGAHHGAATTRDLLHRLRITGSAPLVLGVCRSGTKGQGKKEVALALQHHCSGNMPKGMSMMVAQRGFCTKPGGGGEPGRDLWRLIFKMHKLRFKMYKLRFVLGVENWLWGLGFRPGTPFTPYLVLMGLTLTSQSATEVAKWVAAAARLVGPSIPRISWEEVEGGVLGYVDGVASAIEEDGCGWGY